MRQVEPNTNKVAFPSLTHDNTWRTATLTGLDADTKFVLVEMYTTTNSSTAGVRQVGDSTGAHASQVLEWNAGPGATEAFYTQFVAVNGSDQIQYISSSSNTVFSVMAELGGDGVVAFSAPVQTPTWVDANWRTVNLTSDFGGDAGKVEAVICRMSRNDGSGGSTSDARGVGSTWSADPNGQGGATHDMIVKVDSNDDVETQEGGAGKSPAQVGVVYFLGYILAGEFDDGTGTDYSWTSILNPVDETDGIAAWETFDATSRTSSTAEVAYVRTHITTNNSAFFEPTYIREIGSTNTEIESQGNEQLWLGFLVELDSSQDYERYLPTSDIQSYVFGYLEVSAAPISTISGTGLSVQFDGKGQYLGTTGSFSLGIDNTWTLGFWAKPRSYKEHASIFSTGGKSSENEISISSTALPQETGIHGKRPAELRVVVKDANGTIIKNYGWGDYFQTDTWSHVAVEWNGTDLDAFKDGVPTVTGVVLTESGGTMSDSPDRKVFYGATISGVVALFSGTLGHFGMWNSLLSASELGAIVSGGLFMDLTTASGNYVSQGNLQHYWRPGDNAASLGQDFLGSLVLDKERYLNSSNIVADQP